MAKTRSFYERVTQSAARQRFSYLNLDGAVGNRLSPEYFPGGSVEPSYHDLRISRLAGGRTARARVPRGGAAAVDPVFDDAARRGDGPGPAPLARLSTWFGMPFACFSGEAGFTLAAGVYAGVGVGAGAVPYSR